MWKIFMQEYPKTHHEPVMLREYDSFCDEANAWRQALADVEKRGVRLCNVEVYDTRLHHRAVHFGERRDADGTVVAEAGWYNARSTYHRVDNGEGW